jgi:aminoglycoside N3'-acetyltransferase
MLSSERIGALQGGVVSRTNVRSSKHETVVFVGWPTRANEICPGRKIVRSGTRDHN